MAGVLDRMLDEARAADRGGRIWEAIAAFQRILLQHPEAAEAWAEYGGLLLAAGRPREAIEACGRTLALFPDHRPAMSGLAKAHLQLGQWAEAEALCARILARDPGDLGSSLDLAWCLMRQGKLARSRSVLEAAAAAHPEDPSITNLLIQALVQQEDWTALRQEMLRRVDADYAGPVAAWERACVDLLFGDMPSGWDGFESRWGLPEIQGQRRRFAKPPWQGENPAGKTLLLHCEQGFGDTLMFLRYVPMVKAMGARVFLLVQPELAGLAATCAGADEVVVEGGPLPAFDLHLPLMSLPRIFRTGLATIPAETPYLDVPERVPHRRALAEALAAAGPRIRVGIAWAGRATHARDRQRSIPAEALAPLGSLPGVAWYAFQLGAREGPPLPGWVSLAPLLGDFSDTAYALSGMDLVITVDTALAHLAGALAIPTLMLVSYLPDWRWLMGRDDSPWYPTLRLYRQPAFGDWGSVVQAIRKDLGDR